MEDALVAFMRGYATFVKTDLDAILPCWQPVLAKARNVLLRPGQTCRHVYFLHAGLMRYFYLSDEGEEVTKFFTEPPYVFTAQRSLNLATPSAEGITLVADAELLVIEKADVDRLFAAKLHVHRYTVRNGDAISVTHEVWFSGALAGFFALLLGGTFRGQLLAVVQRVVRFASQTPA